MVYNKKETNDEAEKTNIKVQTVVKKYPTNLEPNVKKFMEWEDQVLEEMWEERGWNTKQTKLKLNFSGDGDIKVGKLIVYGSILFCKNLVNSYILAHSPS